MLSGVVAGRNLSLARPKNRLAMTTTGTVKWFDRKKGIGFATPEGGTEDVFVHRRNIISEGGSPVLDEGDVITFDMGEHEGRQTAINVKMPEGKPTPEKRRNRGRNAKKAADEESEVLAGEAQEAANARMSGEDKTGEEGGGGKGGGGAGEGGGRDSKTRRHTGGRPRRNDKGLGDKPVNSSAGAGRRNDAKGETKASAVESAAE